MKLVVNHKSHILDDGTNILANWARDAPGLDQYHQWFNQYGVPEILISEAYPECPDLPNGLQYYYCPTFLHNQTSLLTNNCTFDNQPTQHCFNFMINKKQINRFLLLKLIEWFDLSCYQYTWSGTGQQFDMTRCLDDFDTLADRVDVQKFKAHMLAPVSKISPNFVNTDLTIKTNVDRELSGVVNYGGNDWVWNHVVRDIFERSAVSLISESVQYEKLMIYTEKTLYAMLGLTFPIWIGGYRQADLWKQHGFDVFDDVVDHSYQHRDTLLERCFYAINDNLSILSDLEHAKDLRYKHIQRLEQNRSMMQSNIHGMVASSMAKLPKILQNFIADHQQ